METNSTNNKSKTLKNVIIAAVFFITLIQLGAQLVTGGVEKIQARKEQYNSIKNPENKSYLQRVAKNLNKQIEEVSQEDFDQKYSTFSISYRGETFYIYEDDDSPYLVHLKDGSLLTSEDLGELVTYLQQYTEGTK